MKVLAALTIAAAALVLLAVFAQSPAITGGPNPYDSPDGQSELRVITIGCALAVGIAWQAFRDHGGKGGA